MEDSSTEFWASVSESHVRKLFFDPFPLHGIIRFRNSISQCEKPPLFGFFGLDAGLDQINHNTIGAGLPGFGDSMHVFCNAMWKRYALTNRSFQPSHGLMLHHCAPECTIIANLLSKPDSLVHLDVSCIRWFDLPIFRLEAHLRFADNTSTGTDA